MTRRADRPPVRNADTKPPPMKTTANMLDLEAGNARKFTLAYLVRAVTPGVYRQPAVYVEDMYQPWQFGRGALGVVKVE